MTDSAAVPPIETPIDKRSAISWCLYDWANSGFPAVITTFVFATYFTQGIAETPETGTALWGNAMAVSGILIALLAPAVGAISDKAGPRKPFLAALTALCCVATAFLWFAEPDAAFIPLALAGVIVATIGFEFSTVFYNAMLADVAPRRLWGRISGWGWGLGYAGGLVCLVFCLLAFIQTDTPLFGLGTENAENVRATVVVVAVWYAVFCLPLFLFTPDRPATGLTLRQSVNEGVATLIATLKKIRDYKQAFRFLIARMIFTDGLNTLFAFGGIYAAGTFGMDVAEVIQFGIALNITAGLGAAGFAVLDDRIGAKPVITISLLCLIALSFAALMVDDKTAFFVIGLGIGAFLGPVQASSRSMMARLAPADLRTEFFGLYAFSGKATAFVGPLVLGWVTLAFDSQRAGMATIIVFLVVGLVLLQRVKKV
ncbi:MAG: MFS transporter [Alphaproteobacteria bacterium]